jgi:hypothetical protein
VTPEQRIHAPKSSSLSSSSVKVIFAISPHYHMAFREAVTASSAPRPIRRARAVPPPVAGTAAPVQSAVPAWCSPSPRSSSIRNAGC